MRRDLREATSTADLALARALISEYLTELGEDLAFQGVQAELDGLPGRYGPPGGALLLAGEAGVVGLRDLGEGLGEIKRMYVRPEARGTGLGAALTEGAIERAGELGYDRLVLDSLERLEAALRLYARFGFERCAPYYANPIPAVVYMRLELGERRPT